jgi:hypothetical protein
MLCWARFREQSCLGRSARWPVLLWVMRPDRRLRTPGDCGDHTTRDTPAGRRRRSPPRMQAKTGPLRGSTLQRLRRLFHQRRLLHRRRLRQGLHQPCRRCSRWNESFAESQRLSSRCANRRHCVIRLNNRSEAWSLSTRKTGSGRSTAPLCHIPGRYVGTKRVGAGILLRTLCGIYFFLQASCSCVRHGVRALQWPKQFRLKTRIWCASSWTTGKGQKRARVEHA